jgi:hypothetical protein
VGVKKIVEVGEVVGEGDFDILLLAVEVELVGDTSYSSAGFTHHHRLTHTIARLDLT